MTETRPLKSAFLGRQCRTSRHSGVTCVPNPVLLQTRKLYDGAVISLGDCKATYTLRVQKPASSQQGAGGTKRKR